MRRKNPGDKKLSITEYNNGGAQHIAGHHRPRLIISAFFGAQGLFCRKHAWPLVTTSEAVPARRLSRVPRDFDGANHNFGDTSVQATSSNVGNVSLYVSTDSTRPGRVVVVAINRSDATQTTAISGQPLSGTAHLFQMTAATAATQSTAAGGLRHSGGFRILLDDNFAQLECDHHRYLLIAVIIRTNWRGAPTAFPPRSVP